MWKYEKYRKREKNRFERLYKYEIKKFRNIKISEYVQNLKPHKSQSIKLEN